MLNRGLSHAVAVDRSGSFSGAAETVGVTQSAVTKSVAELERRLGYPLFHRTSRGTVATEEGRSFLDRAAVLLSDTAALFREERGSDPHAGILRVGVFPGSLEWVLLDTLVELTRRYPTIRLDIVSGTSERGVYLLSRGDVDIVVGMHAAFRHWPQFQCEKFAVLEVRPFVRHGHPLVTSPAGKTLPIVDFQFIAPSASEPYSSTIRRIYEVEGKDPDSHIHVIDFFPLVRRMVASSDAIGIASISEIARPTFRQHFTVLDKELFAAPILCTAVRARWALKPSALTLRDMLRGSARTI